MSDSNGPVRRRRIAGESSPAAPPKKPVTKKPAVKKPATSKAAPKKAAAKAPVTKKASVAKSTPVAKKAPVVKKAPTSPTPSTTPAVKRTAPVVPVASSCPWCGVAEPGEQPVSSAELGAWLLAGGVSLSMAAVLVDALTRALG